MYDFNLRIEYCCVQLYAYVYTLLMMSDVRTAGSDDSHSEELGGKNAGIRRQEVER